MTEIALTIDHVTKQFSGTQVPALKDVSLEVVRSEILGIIGHSGAGKSTLVRMMNGLETPDKGEVSIGDFIISTASERLKREHRRDIGMIFQHFNLFSSRTVAANVAYPLRIAGWKKAERQARVKELLAYVGLEQFAERYPEQLSGGQKQRVGIARALAAEPKILLADEATSALDPNTTREVLTLLKQINRDFGLTIIVITHHMSILKAICDRVAVLDAGEIVEIAQVYDFFSAPQSEVSRNFLPAFIPAQENEIVIDIRRNPDWLSVIQEYSSLEWTIVEAQIDQLQGKAYGSVRVNLVGNTTDIVAFQERITGVRWA